MLFKEKQHPLIVQFHQHEEAQLFEDSLRQKDKVPLPEAINNWGAKIDNRLKKANKPDSVEYELLKKRVKSQKSQRKKLKESGSRELEMNRRKGEIGRKKKADLAAVKTTVKKNVARTKNKIDEIEVQIRVWLDSAKFKPAFKGPEQYIVGLFAIIGFVGGLEWYANQPEFVAMGYAMASYRPLIIITSIGLASLGHLLGHFIQRKWNVLAGVTGAVCSGILYAVLFEVRVYDNGGDYLYAVLTIAGVCTTAIVAYLRAETRPYWVLMSLKSKLEKALIIEEAELSKHKSKIKHYDKNLEAKIYQAMDIEAANIKVEIAQHNVPLQRLKGKLEENIAVHDILKAKGAATINRAYNQ